MKIVSDCFNFVKTVLSYHIMFKNVLDISYMSISQGRHQDFGSGRGGTSDKISYMNFSQVLYCNGISKIMVLGGHSARMYSSKTFENFRKIYKKFTQKF